MGAYFSLISQPRQSLGGRLWHDITQGPWLASQLCRMHCRQSLHPGLRLSWQDGRDSPGRGRSYFCNLRHPDLVSHTQLPKVSKAQLEFSNLSRIRRVRTGCQPTQSTSGPVPEPAEHTPSQGGRCPRRAALGQSHRGISPSRLGATAWLLCCSHLSFHQDKPVSGTLWALNLNFTGGSMSKESTCSTEDQETWVPSLGQEDPLKEEMAIHSSILAWRIPWTEEPGRLQSMGSQRAGQNLATKKQKQAFSGQKKILNKIKMALCTEIVVHHHRIHKNDERELYQWTWRDYWVYYLIIYHAFMSIFFIYIYIFYV